MMRRQLSALLKQLIGLVRRRTSLKARSMALVVLIRRQSPLGQLRKERSSSRSLSKQATALGASPRHLLAHSFARLVASRLVLA